MNTKTNELPWEVFDEDAYNIGLNILIEYKSERLLIEDEWGSEHQYRVYDVRLLIDFDTNYINVPIDKRLRSDLEERIEQYLNR
jgi:hypothetical protein